MAIIIASFHDISIVSYVDTLRLSTQSLRAYRLVDFAEIYLPVLCVGSLRESQCLTQFSWVLLFVQPLRLEIKVLFEFLFDHRILDFQIVLSGRGNVKSFLT